MVMVKTHPHPLLHQFEDVEEDFVAVTTAPFALTQMIKSYTILLEILLETL